MSSRKSLSSKSDREEMDLGNRAGSDRMTDEDLARMASIPLEAAARIMRGEIDELDMETLRRALPFLEECPVCGAAITDESGSIQESM